MKVLCDIELPVATKVVCDSIEQCTNVSFESALTSRLYQFSFCKGWRGSGGRVGKFSGAFNVFLIF